MKSSLPTSDDIRWTLAMETSTLTMSVALLDGDTVQGERLIHTLRGHAMIILPEVSSLLESNSVKSAELDLIVVSTGPGSFTGIRIGMATARALIRGTGALGIGVGSLEVLASGFTPQGSPVATALDARRGEVFGAVYKSGGVEEEPEVVMSPMVASPETFAEAVSAVGVSDLTCIGPGFERYPEMVASIGGHRGVADMDVIHAAIAARMGRRRVLAGIRGGEASLQPIYLRRSDAEINMGPPTGEAIIEHR